MSNKEYLDKWRGNEERQNEMVLILLVCIISHQSEDVGPSTKEKTVSLPSWALPLGGYIMMLWV